MTLRYLHMLPGKPPPYLAATPFRAIVVVDAPVSSEWRYLVSEWLVRRGCLYMMAWGQDCSAWDDSVDYANIAEFIDGAIPPDRFVMTTWHDKETLAEVFWFAEKCAEHPDIDLEQTIIVHIAARERREELLDTYLAANQ